MKISGLRPEVYGLIKSYNKCSPRGRVDLNVRALNQRNKVSDKSALRRATSIFIKFSYSKTKRLLRHKCSIGSSDKRFSCRLGRRHALKGGWTMSLNKKVPYTKSANPRI